VKKRTIDEVLAQARSRLARVAPEDLSAAIEEGAVVIDVRDSALRDAQGPLPGSVVVDLTVLEWRVAPSSDYRTIEVDDDTQVILVCSEGFSSSLAAARLQDLGVSGATDLIGGYKAWATAVSSEPDD
jgi:rhodanese-related sulfurtransferase